MTFFLSQQLHIYNDEFAQPSFTPFECFDVTRCSLWETNAFLMRSGASLRLAWVRTCSCRFSGLIVPTEGHAPCRTLAVKNPQKTFFCLISLPCLQCSRGGVSVSLPLGLKRASTSQKTLHTTQTEAISYKNDPACDRCYGCGTTSGTTIALDWLPF